MHLGGAAEGGEASLWAEPRRGAGPEAVVVTGVAGVVRRGRQRKQGRRLCGERLGFGGVGNRGLLGSGPFWGGGGGGSTPLVPLWGSGALRGLFGAFWGRFRRI